MPVRSDSTRRGAVQPARFNSRRIVALVILFLSVMLLAIVGITALVIR